MQTQDSAHDHPVRILKWYAANGVDLAVGDEPVNRFNLGAKPNSGTPPAPTSGTKEPPQTQPIAPTSSTHEEAEIAARAANDLDALRGAYEAFGGCALKLRANKFVFESGTRGADLMIIGDAPSADDDLSGDAFSGRVGELLDKMLAAIGLDRSKTYLSNIVPWRPPGNRNPSPLEIAPCRPFLVRQIELASPKYILCFGELATRTLLGDERLTITRARGQWHDLKVGEWSGPALASLHPSFLLRQPAQKREAWRDLLALQARMESI